MKLYSQDGSELMDVSAIERDGNRLVIKGKIFKSMPMSARLAPEDARQGLKLLNFRTIIFLLGFLFRRSGKTGKAGK
ncbi:MAG: hypothetical protein RQ899_04125 [Pseudomonadales bacterium]|nr:hypothetical protein [Pseudomonadales bacterium]